MVCECHNGFPVYVQLGMLKRQFHTILETSQRAHTTQRVVYHEIEENQGWNWSPTLLWGKVLAYASSRAFSFVRRRTTEIGRFEPHLVTTTDTTFPNALSLFRYESMNHAYDLLFSFFKDSRQLAAVYNAS